MTPLDKPRKEKFAGSYSGASPLAHLGKGERVVTERFPLNTLYFSRDKSRIHPTQKPEALWEYLIKTYTNPGDLVLDNCAGSGTTVVACKQTGRRYLCIEKDRDYWLKACERVNQSNGIS